MTSRIEFHYGHYSRCSVVTGPQGQVQLPPPTSDQLSLMGDQHVPIKKKKKSLFVHPSKSLLSVVNDDEEVRPVSVAAQKLHIIRDLILGQI